MSEVLFADRAEAGAALAKRVARHLTTIEVPGRPLVLGLPRGGVPIARKVAETIDADLDVVVARKIGAPGRPEFGVGAVAEEGPPVFDHTSLRRLGITEDDLTLTVERERAEAQRRVRQYRRGRPAPPIAGRIVIVVDDGLATGVTARAALRWLRTQEPHQLILAIPVSSKQARDALTADADTILCLHCPEQFYAVGQWYADFGQLTDDDVVEALPSKR